MAQKIAYRIALSRNNFTDRNGQREVVIAAYQDGRQMQFKTNIKVRAEQLVGGIVTDHPLASEYNSYLYHLRNKIEKYEIDLIVRGKTVTLQTLRSVVKNNTSVSAPFGEFVRAINATSSTRSEQTKASYETLIRQVELFQRDTRIEDIDLDWVNRFVNWSRGMGLAENTIIGRLKSLRAVMNESVKRKLIRFEDDPFRNYRIPAMKNREEFLSMGELRKVEHLELPRKKKMDRVRDAFLFACYTGFRFSDLNSMRNEHLVSISGKPWIVKKPLKTSKSSGAVVRIPLYAIFGGRALNLIEKYGSLEKLCHVGNNASANRLLKDIVKKIKIPEDRKITFHVARHTTATLLIQQGVPITTIQQILGHTKVSTTQIYTKMTDRTIRRDIEKAFKTQ